MSSRACARLDAQQSVVALVCAAGRICYRALRLGFIRSVPIWYCISYGLLTISAGYSVVSRDEGRDKRKFETGGNLTHITVL